MNDTQKRSEPTKPKKELQARELEEKRLEAESRQINTHIARFERFLASEKERLLPPSAFLLSKRLREAVLYALEDGKRFRALLVYAGAALTPTKDDKNTPSPAPFIDHVALSLEAFHAYTLIHDDLPAMDDDDLRRGRPACHIAFSEAEAILAGDYLQTLAYQCLTQKETPRRESALISVLLEASTRVVIGQAADIQRSDEKNLENEERLAISRLKTGALIQSALQMGYLSTCDLDHQEERPLLGDLGAWMGEVFQIQDDLEDEISKDSEAFWLLHTRFASLTESIEGAIAQLSNPPLLTALWRWLKARTTQTIAT